MDRRACGGVRVLRGVPGSIVYDRTKTVVRRHVAPREAVPLHPEAAAFAEHYGFVIDVLAAYRPTGKGRVERQVAIVRDHVLAGRSFASLAELDAAFTGWVPIRHAQVHRTHGERIGVRAAIDRAALRALPELPYLVCERHLRRVGRDCLIASRARTTRCPPAPATAGSPAPGSGSRSASARTPSPSPAWASTATRSCSPPRYLGGGQLRVGAEVEPFDGDLLVEPGPAQPPGEGGLVAAGDLVAAKDLEELQVPELAAAGLGQPGVEGLEHPGELEGAQGLAQPVVGDHRRPRPAVVARSPRRS